MKIHLFDKYTKETVSSIHMHDDTTVKQAHLFAQEHLRAHPSHTYTIQK